LQPQHPGAAAEAGELPQPHPAESRDAMGVPKKGKARRATLRRRADPINRPGTAA